MAKKIKYENKSRLKLEEKTLKIVTNDLKTIDQLVICYIIFQDQKVKKLEQAKSTLRSRSNNLTNTSFINRSSDVINREETEL